MPDDAARSPESSSRGGAGLAVAVLVICVLLPVLYFFSIGPVIFLLHIAGSDLEILNYIYAPLLWLYHYCEPLRPLMDWYIGLWG